METISLNGIEYVKKEDYDKLQIEKDKVFFVPEICNVLAWLPYDERKHGELKDIIDLNVENLVFKKFKLVPMAKISINSPGLEKPERCTISKSCYSLEYVEKAKKIAKIWTLSDDPTLEAFLPIDEKEEFIEDSPCLLIFNRHLIFALAPRVEEKE